MNYSVNFDIIKINEKRKIKLTQKSYCFPIDTSEDILKVRRKTIAKAKKLYLKANFDESFDSPLTAELKDYKDTKGFIIEIWLNYDSHLYQILGDEESQLDELSGEASFITKLGLNCELEEIEKSISEKWTVLSADLDFLIKF